MAGLKEISQG